MVGISRIRTPLVDCQEHTENVKTHVDDYAAIQAIERALDGQKIRVGKDATVLAIGSIMRGPAHLHLLQPTFRSTALFVVRGHQLSGSTISWATS